MSEVNENEWISSMDSMRRMKLIGENDETNESMKKPMEWIDEETNK